VFAFAKLTSAFCLGFNWNRVLFGMCVSLCRCCLALPLLGLHYSIKCIVLATAWPGASPLAFSKAQVLGIVMILVPTFFFHFCGLSLCRHVQRDREVLRGARKRNLEKSNLVQLKWELLYGCHHISGLE